MKVITVAVEETTWEDIRCDSEGHKDGSMAPWQMTYEENRGRNKLLLGAHIILSWLARSLGVGKLESIRPREQTKIN